jgi:phosphoglycerol transferase MdoB-like AlkP superfamily enzyme
VHISAITRGGAATIDSTPHGTFYAPYASRGRRLDACFGAFIDDLKAHALYGQSLVIVTADHGDSFGEQRPMGARVHEFRGDSSAPRSPPI